jgi:hypothetical protein
LTIEAHVKVLDVLVGQDLLRIEAIHDYHQLHFNEYVLTVFVPWVAGTTTGSFDARKVVAAHETEAEVQIVLADGTSITIDVRPSRWLGPEAMMLSRGEECICVWNE